MKRFYKIFASWFLCLFLVLSQFIVSFADVESLMIGSGSNALMTLELDDNDYSVFALPRSSISNVTNTVDYSGLDIHTRAYTDTSVVWAHTVTDQTGVFKLDSRSSSVIKGYSGLIVRIQKNALPQAGIYRMRFDFTSDFAFDWGSVQLSSTRMIDNVESESNLESVTGFMENSGDLYFDTIIDIGNVKYIDVYCNFADSAYRADVVAGMIKINFQESDGTPSFSTLGQHSSSADYENGVSDSLSDLSSSVDSMTEDLSSAAENLEYISTSQNLIIQGIDNVIMHISDQLYAFWDQLFNLIHLPTLAKMDDIISAINNMDLEIEVNLDGLKQSIQQASQNEIANDNKISADQIANDEANTEEVKDAVKEHGNFIIDGLKGLFIPSDEFFKAYFDDLYSYFSDRFGFLSFPIDLVIRIADLFLTSEKVDAVLTLPSFEISGYKVWEDYSFNFTEFLETSFPFLISAIQTVTSIGLIMAFVNLCQDKWNEVMRS